MTTSNQEKREQLGDRVGSVMPLSDPASNPNRIVNRTERWLQFCFATLSCLGGLALSSGSGADTIPVIALFFACFGFVFVDWLRLFELPPVGAYIAMGAAAVYCVSDFWDMNRTGDQQLNSVALLLVMVQAILMLQRKTPRVFEQLAVFCLLQLVVGAVFNDALQFGMLLIPLGIFGLWALCLMSSVAASEGIEVTSWERFKREQAVTKDVPNTYFGRIAKHWIFRPIGGRRESSTRTVHAWSGRSLISLASATRRLQQFAILALTPAVIMIAAIFFYVLPRTTDAARMKNSGPIQTGFSNQVRLEQFGRMLQDTTTVMRIRLTHRDSGKNYTLPKDIYLRGRVLESYAVNHDRNRPSAIWSAVESDFLRHSSSLPREYLPKRSSDRNFFDTIEAEVTCSAMDSRSLFAMAPYHRAHDSNEILHSNDHWTICRKRMNGQPSSLEYRFGTNAFNNGIQTDVLASSIETSTPRSTILGPLEFDFANPVQELPSGDASAKVRSRRFKEDSYLANLTQIDSAAMPKLHQLAQDIVSSIPPRERSIEAIGRAFERHLSAAGGYDYSLNLNAKTIQGLDPIEQFVSVDKRGHCQYFASALVMMLRSVNVPARMVVGYRTNEFNELGQYYVARQMHAHAWVEVLVDHDQLDSNRVIYGQPQSDQYWLRLDPTPGSNGGGGVPVGGVDQVLTYAEDLWENYIVGMDARRQGESGVSATSLTPMGSLTSWLQMKILQIRAGNLGGGSLAAREFFSWRGALAAMILAILLLVVSKLSFPQWIRRRLDVKPTLMADKPTVPFYADALKELSRLGFERRAGQTPSEFVDETCRILKGARAELSQGSQALHEISIEQPLSTLTNGFYRLQYGEKRLPMSDFNQSMSREIERLRDQVSQLLKNTELMARLKESVWGEPANATNV